MPHRDQLHLVPCRPTWTTQISRITIVRLGLDVDTCCASVAMVVGAAGSHRDSPRPLSWARHSVTRPSRVFDRLAVFEAGLEAPTGRTALDRPVKMHGSHGLLTISCLELAHEV